MRRWPKILSSAGPLAVVLVIFAWAFLIGLGFALIYYALLPGNFKISGGRPAVGFWPMMYFSFEVMTTLGLGDYAPEPIWLGLLVVSEALFGLQFSQRAFPRAGICWRIWPSPLPALAWISCIFPVLYYFRPDRNESSLPYSLPYRLRFAIDAQGHNDPALRRAGAILEIALGDLSGLLKRRLHLTSRTAPWCSRPTHAII